MCVCVNPLFLPPLQRKRAAEKKSRKSKKRSKSSKDSKRSKKHKPSSKDKDKDKKRKRKRREAEGGSSDDDDEAAARAKHKPLSHTQVGVDGGWIGGGCRGKQHIVGEHCHSSAIVSCGAVV